MTPVPPKALLDTDTFSEVLKRRDARVVARATAYRALFGRYSIATVTVMEVVKGLHKLQQSARLQQFLSGLSDVEVLGVVEVTQQHRVHDIGDLLVVIAHGAVHRDIEHQHFSGDALGDEIHQDRDFRVVELRFEQVGGAVATHAPAPVLVATSDRDAFQLARDGVTVNAIATGRIETDRLRSLYSGDRAELIVVWATLDPSKGRAAIKSFVVERDNPGLRLDRLEHKLGIRASDTANFVLDDCRVPKENLLGSPEIEPKRVFSGVMQTFDNTRPRVAGMAIGVARPSPASTRELLIAARLDTTASGPVPLGTSTESIARSSLVDASRRRLRAWGVSDDQIDHVLQTGVVAHTIMLYAPMSGVVLDKKVVQGQAIQAGDMLLSVADLSDVWVDAAIREMDATSVRVGSKATVEFAGYPGRPFSGRVGFVYPTVQGDAHSIIARVAVPNPDGLLKPGMYATVGLDGPSVPVLSVPTSAILNTGEHTLVFVDMGGGSFMPRDVTTGRTAGDYTEVLSGAEPGQLEQHDRRTRPAHAGALDGERRAIGRGARVAPEPAVVIEHPRPLKQRLGEHQRSSRVAGQEHPLGQGCRGNDVNGFGHVLNGRRPCS